MPWSVVVARFQLGHQLASAARLRLLVHRPTDSLRADGSLLVPMLKGISTTVAAPAPSDDQLSADDEMRLVLTQITASKDVSTTGMELLEKMAHKNRRGIIQAEEKLHDPPHGVHLLFDAAANNALVTSHLQSYYTRQREVHEAKQAAFKVVKRWEAGELSVSNLKANASVSVVPSAALTHVLERATRLEQLKRTAAQATEAAIREHMKAKKDLTLVQSLLQKAISANNDVLKFRSSLLSEGHLVGGDITEMDVQDEQAGRGLEGVDAASSLRKVHAQAAKSELQEVQLHRLVRENKRLSAQERHAALVGLNLRRAEGSLATGRTQRNATKPGLPPRSSLRDPWGPGEPAGTYDNRLNGRRVVCDDSNYPEAEGKWYDGKLCKAEQRPDGSWGFSIKFDDGFEESDVTLPDASVRFLPAPPKPSRSKPRARAAKRPADSDGAPQDASQQSTPGSSQASSSSQQPTASPPPPWCNDPNAVWAVIGSESQLAGPSDTGEQPLTPRQEEVARGAVENPPNRRSWAHLGGCEVRAEDFKRFADPDPSEADQSRYYLNSRGLDPLGQMIEVEAGSTVKLFPTAIGLALLTPLTDLAKEAARWTRLRRSWSEVDLLCFRLLLLPFIEQRGGFEHIYYVAVYPQPQAIALVDSYAQSKSASGAKVAVLNAVRRFVQDEYFAFHSSEFSTPPAAFDWSGWRTASLGTLTPQQTDGCSCGIYTLLGMRALARRAPLHEVLRAEKICRVPSYWRRRLALWLYVGKIL